MAEPGVDSLSWLMSLEGVPSAYASARDGVDARLRDRGLRRTTPEQTAESLLRGASASATLAGSASTLEQVRAGERDDVAAAAVRISAELLSLVPVVGRSPLQALARLHVLARGDRQGGRPVSRQAAERLQALAGVLTTRTEVPAMVVAALTHAEVLTVAPFGSYDDLVARAAERLVLVARGVDPASLTVPEAGHLAFRGAYLSQLRAYAEGGRPGLQSWLLYAAEAFGQGAEASPIAG